MDQVKTGWLRGTGSAINVSLGFIPDAVMIYNMTDNDKITIGAPSAQVMAFTSGGTHVLAVGELITGATSTAYAKIEQIILDSGTFAGGDAAGWLILDRSSHVGTFQSENVIVGSGTDDATVVVDIPENLDIDTEVAAATGNAAISAYAGSTTASPGFTVGSTISEDAKLLFWVAFRDGEGGQNRIDSSNSLTLA